MNVQSILGSTPRPPSFRTERKGEVPPVGLTSDDIKKLLPTSQVDEVSSIWELIKPSSTKDEGFPLAQILNQQYQLKVMFLEFSRNIGVDADSGDGYERYLQFPNQMISRKANTIVSRSDSNDKKMYKLEQWVVENIEYKYDIHNYGMNEYWATPSLTLLKESGDCEDGAFLLHSLALHARVPMERLRTYGGFVQNEDGVSLLGGHAWVAYQRESDNEWVELDWCYYPTDKEITGRTPMKSDSKYIDDFFYIDAFKTVETPFINRIRNPESGWVINTYA